MTRSISWADAGAVSKLAASLSKPVAKPKKKQTPKPVAQARSARAAPTTRKLLNPFEPPAGAIDIKMAALLNWAEAAFNPVASFVTDDNGLPVVARRAQPEHVAVSAELMSAMSEVGQSCNSATNRLAVAVSDGQILHLVEVTNEWGRFAVGVVTPEFLEDRELSILQDALALTIGALENV